MTAAPVLLTDPGTVAVVHRLYGLLDSACRASADLGVACCAVLADVDAHPDGLPLRAMHAAYGFYEGDVDFQHQLVERELAEVVRAPHDRRALALRATPKGAERAALVDRLLGVRLVGAFPGLTEENFDRLVALEYDFALASGHPAGAVGLFPAPVLRQLAAYWHIAMVTAARFGMTVTQEVLLSRLCSGAPGPSGAALPSEAEAPLVQVHLAALRDKGLVQEGDSNACTEAGAARVAAFTQRLGAGAAPGWEALSPREQAALGKLLQYVLYLFS